MSESSEYFKIEIFLSDFQRFPIVDYPLIYGD